MRWWTVLCVMALVGCGGGDGPAQPPPVRAPWAVASSGPGTDACVGVAAHVDRSVAATGDFDASIVLGQAQTGETTFDPLGATDAYVARFASDGSLTWARHLGGLGIVAARGVARLGDGSVVVAGTFELTATLGIGEADAATLTSTGAADVFLARFAPDGSLVWVTRAGGEAWDDPRGIDAFPDGSFVVTGYYQSPTMTFGEGEPNETVLTSGGATECFVARYAADGRLLWAKRAGGDLTCSGNDVAAFDGGASIVAMRIEGTMTIGAGEANEQQFVSWGERDVLLARYEADGTFAWARQAGGAARDVPWGIETYGNGSFAMVGLIAGEATYGQGDPNETTLTDVGFWDVVVARFNADGSLAWAQRLGGPDRDIGRDVATFADGSCVVVARTEGDVTVSPGAPGETLITGHGDSDAFVARFRGDGSLVWAETMGGTLDDAAVTVSGLSDGTFAVGGFFREALVFLQGTADEIVLPGDESQDAFVVYSGTRYR